jgi:hypothetical protein
MLVTLQTPASFSIKLACDWSSILEAFFEYGLEFGRRPNSTLKPIFNGEIARLDIWSVELARLLIYTNLGELSSDSIL